MNLWTGGWGAAGDYWNEFGNTHKYLCVCVRSMYFRVKGISKMYKKYRIFDIIKLLEKN